MTLILVMVFNILAAFALGSYLAEFTKSAVMSWNGATISRYRPPPDPTLRDLLPSDATSISRMSGAGEIGLRCPAKTPNCAADHIFAG